MRGEADGPADPRTLRLLAKATASSKLHKNNGLTRKQRRLAQRPTAAIAVTA